MGRPSKDKGIKVDWQLVNSETGQVYGELTGQPYASEEELEAILEVTSEMNVLLGKNEVYFKLSEQQQP